MCICTDERKSAKRKINLLYMNTDQAVQRFANTLGDHYDIFYEAVPWHDDFQDSIVTALQNNLINKTNPVLLEAGFGTGITTKKVISAFPQANIIAIDNVANMAKKAEEYIGRDSIKSTSFIIGELLDELKKIPSKSVDGFYSGYVLHNIDSEIRTQIITEIYRVLKPGGVYSNGDRIANDDPVLQKQALAQALVNINIFFTKYNDADYYLEWIRHYLRDEEPDLIFRANDQVELLKTNGFKSIQYVFQHGLEQTCIAIK